MEMDKVPVAGYRIEGLDIAGISRNSILKNISVPVKVLKSVNKAKEIIATFKPDAIVGVGGYASGPTLWAGMRNQIPTLIQEQNSYPGITNKILSRYARKICVAYDGMEKYFPKNKIIVTGNPVRQDITDLENKRNEALEYFRLKNNALTVLVIGGSLGARTINESMAASLELFAKNNIQLVWQTGKAYYAQAQEIEKRHSNIRVFDFISKMDYAYAASDIVVSRAGALSLSELCITGLPSILVPSPNVSEDHQTKNAMELVNRNAAILVKDTEALNKLGNSVVELAENNELRNKLSKNISALAIKDSAARIAQEVIALTEQK